ncbi:MAG: MFS transporter [Pseudomonadales bacterium]
MATAGRSPLLAAMSVRPFRWFWIATAVSLLGDQLTLIALPWLVLKLTDDALALGSVIALAAIPRAVFMLVGGALTDRWSPRRVLLASALARMALVALIAYATFTGRIDMPFVYLAALLFGLADAFSFPAQAAMPPRLLDDDQLAGGNALVQGTAQLSLVVGPALAGVLIAMASTGGIEPQTIDNQRGLAVVFAIDALTFLLPAIVLSLIRERPGPQAPDAQSLTGALLEGLVHTWRDLGLRYFVGMLAILSLVFRGPFMVGVPAFADRYLDQDAAGFGTLMSALGIGAIIGTLLAGMFSWPRDARLGLLLAVDFLGFGVVFLSMTLVDALWPLAAAICAAAVVDGVLTIRITTWIQRRVPRLLLGRVMSVLIFFNLGLFPLSSAVAGAAAEVDLRMMIGSAGALLILVALAGMALPGVRRLGEPAGHAQR